MTGANQNAPIDAPAPRPRRARRATRKVADAAAPRRETPAKQVAANHPNAHNTIGPTSPGGERKSSRNPLEHGSRAPVVDVPGEDPDVFDRRFDARAPELNPLGLASADFAVATLVRTSLDLDRLHASRTARLAGLARDARRDRADARLREAEGLIHAIADDPPAAVRRPRRTTEGCRALLAEWAAPGACLIAPSRWDEADASRAQDLRGQVTDDDGGPPDIFVIPTEAIVEHRDLARRPDRHGPHGAHRGRLYHTEASAQADRDRLPGPAEASDRAVEWVAAPVASEESGPLERIVELSEDERADAEEAPLRARLDASEGGRLLHRYEVDAQRSFLRTYTAPKAGAREQMAQIKSDQEIKPCRPHEGPAVPPPSGASSPAPNEAISGGPRHEGMPIRGGGNGPDRASAAVPAAPVRRPDRE